MAKLFVSSTGSNTSPYETWAKAATSLATAVTAATGDGDIIAIDIANVPSGDKELAANATWTALNNISIIASTNTGTDTITPTPMGTNTWLGNSTTARYITINGAYKVLLYGLTLRVSSTSTCDMNIGTSNYGDFELVDCYIWNAGTTGTHLISLGSASAGDNSYVKVVNTTFANLYGNSAYVSVGDKVEFFSCAFQTINVHGNIVGQSPSAKTLYFESCDFTACLYSTLVGSAVQGNNDVIFNNCKLLKSSVLLATSGGAQNRSTPFVYIYNSMLDSEFVPFKFINRMGTLETTGQTYKNDTEHKLSWKITTTANCTYTHPFVSPTITMYNDKVNETLSPIIECLAITNSRHKIWAEVGIQDMLGSPVQTIYTDRLSFGDWANVNYIPHPIGSELYNWISENPAHVYSLKIGAGREVIAREKGNVVARVFCGEPSTTFYVDPRIRL